MIPTDDQQKAAAAESAVARVTDGMVVGLGSGSTAAFAVQHLAMRVKKGLRIVGVPTSERTAQLAHAGGIPISNFEFQVQIDLTIDGADQVEESSLNLIKGRGGALVREKIVACASKSLVIIVDESKLRSHLVLDGQVPVEVVPFGWRSTARSLSKLGASISLREGPNGTPFVSDGGNYILDCSFPADVPAPWLAEQLDHVVGLVEHGLFLGLTSEVHVGTSSGVRILRASG